MELGEFPVNIIETLAHDSMSLHDDDSKRNYIFWDVLEEDGGYVLSKNIISEHYKVTDAAGKRYCSSFDLKKISAKYNDLIKKETDK